MTRAGIIAFVILATRRLNTAVILLTITVFPVTIDSESFCQRLRLTTLRGTSSRSIPTGLSTVTARASSFARLASMSPKHDE